MPNEMPFSNDEPDFVMASYLALFSARGRTRKFYEMLEKRRKESREHPERLVPLEKIV